MRATEGNSMDVGIVGLPQSGKTTVFNAVTRGSAETTTYGAGASPNLGVAKVPDGRLAVLEGIFKPKRRVLAEVTYVDIAGASNAPGESGAIVGESLNHLQRADVLLIVARAFDDPSVPYAAGGIDPYRDAETMLDELANADLQILERRLARISEGFKSAKPPEREALNKEQSLLNRLKADLESGTALRDQELAIEDARPIKGFRLLTAKPLIILFNVGENQLSEVASLEEKLSSTFTGPRIRVAALCGKLEMELVQMDPEDEREFRDSLQAADSGVDRMISVSHDVSDVITFFTGNANEVRAWTLARGTPALNAAGKIHSDLERGFIRAEVVGYDDLARCGTISEAKKNGLVRQEGKTYVVAEGDVVNVLFNV